VCVVLFFTGEINSHNLQRIIHVPGHPFRADPSS
jgi:hypothetical protein